MEFDDEDIKKIIHNYIKDSLEIEYKEESVSYGEFGHKCIALILNGEEISTTYI